MEGRLVPRMEALAQAVAERAVEIVVSAVDMNALLDGVDLNALLDQVDFDQVLARIDLDQMVGRLDLNPILARIDVEALVQQTDLGAVIARSSSGVASEVLDVFPQPDRRARRANRPLDRAAPPPPLYLVAAACPAGCRPGQGHDCARGRCPALQPSGHRPGRPCKASARASHRVLSPSA